MNAYQRHHPIHNSLMMVLLLFLATGIWVLPGRSAESDDFNDGNDAGWTRYDPIGSHPQLPDIATFSFPNGGYRIQTASSPSPGTVGQARAGSLRPEIYSDFYVTIDIVNFDPALDQAFGMLARVTDVGLGATDGYALTYDSGGEDLDMTRFTNENPTGGGFATGNLTLVPGRSYRVVWTGKGSGFAARVYALPDLTNPLVEISGSDPAYPMGQNGLIVYAQTATGTTDATFDNYLAQDVEPPRLGIQREPFDELTVFWPRDTDNFILQFTRDLSTTPIVWTDITSGIITNETQKVYGDSLLDGVQKFYRLVRP